jgi:hypothetical protein
MNFRTCAAPAAASVGFCGTGGSHHHRPASAPHEDDSERQSLPVQRRRIREKGGKGIYREDEDGPPTRDGPRNGGDIAVLLATSANEPGRLKGHRWPMGARFTQGADKSLVLIICI